MFNSLFPFKMKQNFNFKHKKLQEWTYHTCNKALTGFCMHVGRISMQKV